MPPKGDKPAPASRASLSEFGRPRYHVASLRLFTKLLQKPTYLTGTTGSVKGV
jgi:hypothetical protein